MNIVINKTKDSISISYLHCNKLHLKTFLSTKKIKTGTLNLSQAVNFVVDIVLTTSKNKVFVEWAKKWLNGDKNKKHLSEIWFKYKSDSEWAVMQAAGCLLDEEAEEFFCVGWIEETLKYALEK